MLPIKYMPTIFFFFEKFVLHIDGSRFPIAKLKKKDVEKSDAVNSVFNISLN